MPTPKIQYVELTNQLANLVKNNITLNDIAAMQYAQQCDILVKTHPAEGYVARMVLEALRGQVDNVISFGKKAEKLLSCSENHDLAIHNFLIALSIAGVYAEFDIPLWIRKFENVAPFPESLHEACALGVGFGLFDMSANYIKRIKEDSTMFQNSMMLSNSPVAELWDKIRQETHTDESELARVLSLVRQSYVQRFKRPATKTGHAASEDGIIFCYIYAPDELAVEDVADFNWDVEDLLESDNSPLLPYLVFDTQFH